MPLIGGEVSCFAFLKGNEMAEQQTANVRYQELTRILGQDLAKFCMCAATDVPYIDDVPVDTVWTTYKRNIQADYPNQTFEDGITDVEVVINLQLSDIDRWKRIWGEGSEESPYTEKDYKRLNELFGIFSKRPSSSGGFDAQQEYYLRQCAMIALVMEKCTKAGDIDGAKKANDTMQSMLSSENLRRKDAKPMENLRVDSIVDALEKAGLVQNGKILDLPDLQEQLLRRLGALGGRPSHKFPYTLDAADQMLYVIANTMYANDDMPEIAELPDKMRFDKNVACEFSDEPNAAEIENYKRMNLVRNFGHEEEKTTRKRKGK